MVGYPSTLYFAAVSGSLSQSTAIKCIRLPFTLFVPICYTRKNEDSYLITEFPEFCKTLKELPTDNFEIG